MCDCKTRPRFATPRIFHPRPTGWGIQMRFFVKSWPQASDQGGTFLPCKRNEHLIGFRGKINCSAIMHGHSAALMG